MRHEGTTAAMAQEQTRSSAGCSPARGNGGDSGSDDESGDGTKLVHSRVNGQSRNRDPGVGRGFPGMLACLMALHVLQLWPRV